MIKIDTARAGEGCVRTGIHQPRDHSWSFIPHTRGPVGVLRDEILFLVLIAAQVEEVGPVVALQEFPVAFANGGLSHPAPVKRIVWIAGCFSRQKRDQIDAVDFSSRFKPAAASAVAVASRAITGRS